MNPPYVIVQAGGKGTRMKELTRNKPKALVPIENRPMLFHLFERYPDSQFIVIGDYLFDVLERYLRAFAAADYKLVRASDSTGTCAGLPEALTYIPENTPFLLIWSDLVLPKSFDIADLEHNQVGISQGFRCRWRYERGRFVEEPSENTGVAGLFVFSNKGWLADVPKQGEFVRWLQSQKIPFRELPLCRAKEYGLSEEYQRIPTEKCRPFNRITIQENRIIKGAVDRHLRSVRFDGTRWYVTRVFPISRLFMEPNR